MQSIINSRSKRLYIATVAILGVVILNAIPTQAMAQSGPRVNWYEICKNPIVDLAIVEPCHELTTNAGYTLTPKGERVLACIGGGAAAILAGYPQLLALKNQVGCNTGSHSSSSSLFSSSSGNSRDSDPIGNLIESLFG